MKVSLRLIPFGVVLILALVACRSGNSGPTSGGPEVDSAPDISEVNEIDLVITLLEEWWDRIPERIHKVWFFETSQWLSDGDRQRIRDTIGVPVEFYTDAWEPVVPGTSHYPEGEVSISFSNMRKLKEDVIGINSWGSSGLESGTGTTSLFRWDGQNWVRTEPDQVGVTVTSAVS